MPPGIPKSVFASLGAKALRAGPRFGAWGPPNARFGATGPVIPTGFGVGSSQFGRERRSQSISQGDSRLALGLPDLWSYSESALQASEVHRMPLDRTVRARSGGVR
jgi:hypothetical protein